EEDGIRDRSVTGVQTCALPIYPVTELQERGGEQIEGVHHPVGDGDGVGGEGPVGVQALEEFRQDRGVEIGTERDGRVQAPERRRAAERRGGREGAAGGRRSLET